MSVNYSCIVKSSLVLFMFIGFSVSTSLRVFADQTNVSTNRYTKFNDKNEDESRKRMHIRHVYSNNLVRINIDTQNMQDRVISNNTLVIVDLIGTKI